MMTATLTSATLSQPAESVGMLRWIFCRGAMALTCELRASEQGTFDVSVVPHWDVASSMVEHHPRASSGMRRHAEIASSLREAGWSVLR